MHVSVQATKQSLSLVCTSLYKQPNKITCMNSSWFYQYWLGSYRFGSTSTPTKHMDYGRVLSIVPILRQCFVPERCIGTMWTCPICSPALGATVASDTQWSRQAWMPCRSALPKTITTETHYGQVQDYQLNNLCKANKKWERALVSLHWPCWSWVSGSEVLSSSRWSWSSSSAPKNQATLFTL
jgi:hypothetical protein